MQDVLIQRCTLRIVRRGGWSWGADPRRLLRNALEAVPSLVAARLGEWLAAIPGDAEIAQPIRIRLTIRLDELRAFSRADVSTADGRSLRWLGQLDDALKEAVASAPVSQSPSKPREALAPVVPEAPAAPPAADVLRAALLEWRRTGLLAFLLAAATDDVVERWLETLGLAPHHDAPSSRARGAAADAPMVADPAMASYEGRAAIARLIEWLDRTAGSTSGSAPSGEVHAGAVAQPERRRLNAGGPGVADDPDAAGPAIEPGKRVLAHAPAIRSPEPPPAVVRDVAIDGEVQVPSVLPWLVLVPLQRLGWLRVLRVALEAAGVERASALFGAALAYKLAASSPRAWQKSTDAERTAMAIAAQRNPIQKPDLHRFAHRLGPHCPLLDAHIAHLISQGKRAEDPWLLDAATGEGPRFSLFDPEGLFPAWWSLDEQHVVDALRTHPGADVLVTDTAADPGLLQRFTTSGLRFVTTSRPGRGEAWTRVSGAAQTWWGNLAGGPAPGTRRRMSQAADLAERSGALIAEFTARRLALPLAPEHGFERALSLAAAVALGTIARELWQARGATDPVLAISRLGDLHARIRFSRRSVRVLVSMGRRHRDLYDAGLLADVDEVPWLDGRTLEFSGG